MALLLLLLLLGAFYKCNTQLPIISIICPDNNTDNNHTAPSQRLQALHKENATFRPRHIHICERPAGAGSLFPVGSLRDTKNHHTHKLQQRSQFPAFFLALASLAPSSAYLRRLIIFLFVARASSSTALRCNTTAPQWQPHITKKNNSKYIKTRNYQQNITRKSSSCGLAWRFEPRHFAGRLRFQKVCAKTSWSTPQAPTATRDPQHDSPDAIHSKQTNLEHQQLSFALLRLALLPLLVAYRPQLVHHRFHLALLSSSSDYSVSQFSLPAWTNAPRQQDAANADTTTTGTVKPNAKIYQRQTTGPLQRCDGRKDVPTAALQSR